ncbi:MAG: aminopeptidase P family protein [Chloroflexi bacterium]|nr:aminopeptidase P family protein [Chloroflexota bacterium]
MSRSYRFDIDSAPLTRESLGIPKERERYALRKQLIQKKLNTSLLPAMRKHGIDMWLVLSREFHPDPVLYEIGGGWPGVRNAYIFFDNGGDTPEKIFIGSHEQRESLFHDVYDQVVFYGYSQEGLAPFLRDAVQKRNPQRIGVNMSKTLPMADGLSAVLKHYLEEAIGDEYARRLTSAELVVRDYRGGRLPEEVALYRRLCEWTVAWCAEGFSRRVVLPGVTTTDDIHWWMRDKARELGLDVEFLPGMRINRQGRPIPTNSPDHPILPGDIVTMDAGLSFDLFRSDYQRTAYVVRPGETEPPASLRRAFADALCARDQLTARIAPGKIAHVVWDETMEWAKSQGYQVMYPAAAGRRETVTAPQVGIYSHSIGNSTHGIGARIAVDWPVAYGDRVRYPLGLNEWYSIELGVSTPIPEWDGRAVFVGIEEDAALTERGIEYFAQPQTELIVIPA